MKEYQEIMVNNTGFAGTTPGLATKLTEAAQAGWRFVAMIPVPGTYVCALVERESTSTLAYKPPFQAKPTSKRK